MRDIMKLINKYHNKERVPSIMFIDDRVYIDEQLLIGRVHS